MRRVILKRHAKQKQFLNSNSPYVLLRGGRGSGKTHAGAMFAAEQLIKYPDVLGLVAANTFSQLNKFTLAKLMMLLDSMEIEYVIGKKPPDFWPRYRKLKDYDGILTLRTGGQCLLVSLERYDTAARGGDLGWAWLDETRDTDPRAIDVVLGAFRGFTAKYPDWIYKLRVTTTPNGFDHVWSRFAVNGDNRLPDSEDIHCHTRDNVFEQGFADRLLGVYSERQAAQEILGEYISLTAGRAFDFSRERNCVKTNYDNSLPLILSMDFNVAPLCGVVMQINKSNKTAVVLDEIYIPDDGQTRDACNMFHERWKAVSPLVHFYGDVAGDHRDTRQNVSDIAIMQQTLDAAFKQRCKNITGPKGRIKNGVNAVNAMLNPAAGLPRLTIDGDKCPMLIRDLEQVSWKKGTVEIDKINKLLTHMCDALRYPIQEFFPIDADIEHDLNKFSQFSIIS